MKSRLGRMRRRRQIRPLRFKSWRSFKVARRVFPIDLQKTQPLPGCDRHALAGRSDSCTVSGATQTRRVTIRVGEHFLASGNSQEEAQRNSFLVLIRGARCPQRSAAILLNHAQREQKQHLQSCCQRRKEQKKKPHLEDPELTGTELGYSGHLHPICFSLCGYESEHVPMMLL